MVNLLLLSALFTLLAGAEPAVARAEAPAACVPTANVKAMLAAVKEAGNPLDSMTPQNVPGLWRARELGARRVLRPLPLAKVEDRIVPARNYQIPARIYTPSRGAKLPVVVYFHGGGWTLGSLAAYDSVARELARKARAIVISVDYRLAPEHPFPAAVDDAYLALEWAARNAADLGGDPTKLVVAGDSAGGNLAAVVARKAALAGLPLALQFLFYPSVDIGNMDYPSYAELGRGYLLTQKSVEDFRSFYLPKQNDWTNPDAAPLRAPEAELAKVAPAILVLPGCDPLRDEGLAYAEKLRAAGVRAELHREPGLVHGYLNFYNGALNPKLAEEAGAALNRSAGWLREALRRPRDGTSWKPSATGVNTN